MTMLEPFRKVSPSTLNGFIQAAYTGPGLSKWSIRNGSVAGIGMRDHDLDTTYGFPTYRGEGPWPPETPDQDDIVPVVKKDGKNKDRRKREWDETEDIQYFSKRDQMPADKREKRKRGERPADDGIPQGEHPLDPFWHTKEIKYLLDPILVHLPDVDIVFNEWDEPRVLLAPDYPAEKTEFDEFQTKSYRNAYDDWVEIPCKPFNNKTYENQTYPFAPFLSDLPESKEVCRHPNIGNNYGMVLSPNAMSVTRSLVPIFSMSRISSVADLTYPNILYIEGLMNGEYDETKDGSWGAKKNDLYWTGRTSGGLANPQNNWHEYHRQRFVATINGLVNNSLAEEFQKDKELYKIRFPAVNQCDEKQCDEMTKFFSVDGKPDPFDEVYKHRFQLDIDGNVFSRRFYSLMFSKSTVVKQTWQQEYFDEWLFPWVHYVPLSMVCLSHSLSTAMAPGARSPILKHDANALI
jgi:hypothetical protein